MFVNKTGLKGPIIENNNDWDIEYKSLHEHLKGKKVLTEEICQERANPLIPPDGIIEEDLEIIQYFGGQKQSDEAGKREDMRQTDLRNFKKARKVLVYKEEDFLTLKILPSKRPPASHSEKIKKRFKISKIVNPAQDS